MKPIPEDMIPDDLFPMFGEGLGIEGAHAFQKKNDEGVYVALCGKETLVLSIGSRGNLCTRCVELMAELEEGIE
jgi:hypothetical protein